MGRRVGGAPNHSDVSMYVCGPPGWRFLTELQLIGIIKCDINMIEVRKVKSPRERRRLANKMKKQLFRISNQKHIKGWPILTPSAMHSCRGDKTLGTGHTFRFTYRRAVVAGETNSCTKPKYSDAKTVGAVLHLGQTANGMKILS